MVSWYGSIEAVLYIQGKIFRISHSSVEEARSFSSSASDLLSLSTSKKYEKDLLFLSFYSLQSGISGEEKGWLRHLYRPSYKFKLNAPRHLYKPFFLFCTHG
jgi:hypothetical protein